MRRSLICTFYAPVFVLAIFAGCIDRAVAEESGNPYQRACDTCLKYCRGEPTCAAHCQAHDCQGRPYPGAVNAPPRAGTGTTGPTKVSPPNVPAPAGNRQ
jgi:hypothetical protein